MDSRKEVADIIIEAGELLFPMAMNPNKYPIFDYAKFQQWKSKAREIIALLAAKAEKTMDDGRTVDQFIHDQYEYDDPANPSNLDAIEAIKKLQEALAPFIGDDVDCEDPRGSAFYCDEPLECEEAGKPREAWCPVCHARAVLGETEELIKELENNG